MPSIALEPLITQAATGPTVKTVSSVTGLPLVELPQSTPEEVTAACTRAASAQQRWAAAPARDRAKLLLRFQDLVRERQDEIIDLIQVETGKSRWHALQEVADCTMNARHYGQRAEQLLAPIRRYGLLPGPTRVVQRRPPIGVVGVISPWNYPFALGLSAVLPALTAGNGVVHKPDNNGALSVLWAQRLLREVGLPDDVYQVVLGDGPTVDAALLQQVDYICFAGTARIGAQIAKQACRRRIGCSLELGGKNPLLVLDDADPVQAAAGSVRDCFTAGGPLCSSSERIYVHERVYDRFVAEFLARVHAMRLGVGLDYGADTSSLSSQRQLDTVRAQVEDAVAKGAHVLSGGRHRPDIGPFLFEPTVLSGVTRDMRCFAEETYGAVVALNRCATVAEAVRLANENSHGLEACVWSGDRQHAETAAAQLPTSTINVTGIVWVSYGTVDAPVGGRKESGSGRQHGAEGLLRFTADQTISRTRGNPCGRHRA